MRFASEIFASTSRSPETSARSARSRPVIRPPKIGARRASSIGSRSSASARASSVARTPRSTVASTRACGPSIDSAPVSARNGPRTRAVIVPSRSSPSVARGSHGAVSARAASVVCSQRASSDSPGGARVGPGVGNTFSNTAVPARRERPVAAWSTASVRSAGLSGETPTCAMRTSSKCAVVVAPVARAPPHPARSVPPGARASRTSKSRPSPTRGPTASDPKARTCGNMSPQTGKSRSTSTSSRRNSRMTRLPSAARGAGAFACACAAARVGGGPTHAARVAPAGTPRNASRKPVPRAPPTARRQRPRETVASSTTTRHGWRLTSTRPLTRSAANASEPSGAPTRRPNSSTVMGRPNSRSGTSVHPRRPSSIVTAPHRSRVARATAQRSTNPRSSRGASRHGSSASPTATRKTRAVRRRQRAAGDGVAGARPPSMVQDLPVPPCNVDYFAVCIGLRADAPVAPPGRDRVGASPSRSRS